MICFEVDANDVFKRETIILHVLILQFDQFPLYHRGHVSTQALEKKKLLKEIKDNGHAIIGTKLFSNYEGNEDTNSIIVVELKHALAETRTCACGPTGKGGYCYYRRLKPVFLWAETGILLIFN